MVTSNDRTSSYTFLSRRFLALLVPLLDLRPPSKIAFGTTAWTPQFPCTHGQNKEESLSAMQRLLSKFNHSDNCTYVYQLSHCKINTLSDYTCSLHLGQSPPRHDEFASLSVAIFHCFVNARVAINISRIFCVSLEVVPIEHRFRSKCFISTHVEC